MVPLLRLKNLNVVSDDNSGTLESCPQSIRSALLLSGREVSARQDAMTYLVRVRKLLVDGESQEQEVLDHIHMPNVVYIQT